MKHASLSKKKKKEKCLNMYEKPAMHIYLTEQVKIDNVTWDGKYIWPKE